MTKIDNILTITTMPQLLAFGLLLRGLADEGALSKARIRTILEFIIAVIGRMDVPPDLRFAKDAMVEQYEFMLKDYPDE